MNSWITAIVVVAMGVFSFCLWKNLEEEELTLPQPDPHEPDYFIEQMTRTTTGLSGELRNILRAERVLHFSDDDSTELARPHMEIYNGAAEPWHVVAESGWISSGNDVVLLHGDVEIWRLGESGERQYQVFTSELRVLPPEQYAETDNPTTIIGPSTVTHAIGMRANFAHDRVELLERVRSRHEVKPKS